MVHFPQRKRVYRGNAGAGAVALPISHAMTDGLALPQARQRARNGFAFPWREAMALMSVLMLIRIIVAADLGLAGYMAKAHSMANGTAFEQYIALAMPLDPVSAAAAEGLGTILSFIQG